MELSLFIWWLCLAIILIIAEVITTTVYLLFLSITCFIAAALAWFNLSFITQILSAGILSLTSIYVINNYKKKHKNRQLNGKLVKDDINNFDIGQVVAVNQWNGNSAKVLYKGAYWQAQYKSTEKYPIPQNGEHIIVDMQANMLLLEYKI